MKYITRRKAIQAMAVALQPKERALRADGASGLIPSASTFLLASGTVSGSATERIGEIQAKAADSFVDSVGFNIHLDEPAYSEGYEGVIKPALADAGIRHIRDGITLNAGLEVRFRDLYDSLRVRSTLITSPLTSTGAQARTFADAVGVQAIAAMEGVNEGDGWFASQVKDWPRAVVAYQQALYRLFKTSPATAHIPIFGPTFISPDNLAKLSGSAFFLDMTNIHPYPSGRNPETTGWGDASNGATYGSLEYCIINMGRALQSRAPIVATETGYHNALVAGDQPGVPEHVSAKYLPRLLLHYFNHRIVRTYVYELLDITSDHQSPDANFGIIRNDGTRKPAFDAIRHLLAALSDPGPPFAPEKLALGVRGTSQVQYSVLQKRDGDIFVALWLPFEAWDPTAYVEKPAPVEAVEVSLGHRVSRAAILVPNESGDWRDIRVTQSRIVLDLSDKVCVLKLTR